MAQNRYFNLVEYSSRHPIEMRMKQQKLYAIRTPGLEWSYRNGQGATFLLLLVVATLRPGSRCTNNDTIIINYYVNRSEGPAQVFFIVLVWMLAAFKRTSREERQQKILSYDNMCHLDNLKMAKKPLPLPVDWQHVWLDITKIIDSVHIGNHRDRRCREQYSPQQLKKEHPHMNTVL